MCAISNIPDDKLDNVTGGMEEDILLKGNICHNCHSADNVILSKDAKPLLGYIPAEQYYCTKCHSSFGPKVN